MSRWSRAVQVSLARAKRQFPDVAKHEHKLPIGVLKCPVEIRVPRIHGVMQAKVVGMTPREGTGKRQSLGIALLSRQLQSLIAGTGLIALVIGIGSEIEADVGAP